MKRYNFLVLLVSVLVLFPARADDLEVFTPYALYDNPIGDFTQEPEYDDFCKSSFAPYGALEMDEEEMSKYLTSLQDGPCARIYEVGDEGPAGGRVFYISDDEGKHGLEAAPDDFSGVEWGCHGIKVEGTNHTEIGSGNDNSEAHAAFNCKSRWGGRVAFDVVKDYKLHGYLDWYVPSRDELMTMKSELSVKDLGNFAKSCYWASTEAWGTFSWMVNFGSGGYVYGEKSLRVRVKPIRTF